MPNTWRIWCVVDVWDPYPDCRVTHYWMVAAGYRQLRVNVCLRAGFRDGELGRFNNMDNLEAKT